MIARIKGWLAAIGLALVSVLGAWLKGRSRGRADAQAREDAAYRETRERIDHAGNDVDSASDADVDRRLRDHAKR
jgi:hypothetical protein